MQVLAHEEVQERLPSAPRSEPWWRRPGVAAAVLLAFYLLVSVFIDPRGQFSNDIGGKTASVQEMVDSSTWDPGLSYWFEDSDPEGRFHHAVFTNQTANGTWLNATTFTMLLPARILWEIGGERAILLIPMLGAVFAALAARAFHRRLRPDDDGMETMWVVGLVSPVTVYGLVFWEHSWGVALIVFALALTLDACADATATRRALLAGVLFGIAATMRQEALVYGFVAGITVGATWLRRGQWATALQAGSKMLLGAIGPIAAHTLLELAFIGTSQRTSRATGTVQSVEGSGERGLEALATTVFALPSVDLFVIVLSFLLVASTIACAASVARRPHSEKLRPATVALSVAWVLWAMAILIVGPNFVPGFIIAAPLSMFGLFGAIKQRWNLALWLGVLAPLPLVLLTRFVGGAFPNWAGRYHLASTVVLIVMGVIWLKGRDQAVLRIVLAFSLLVTAVGVWVVVDRSNGVGDSIEQIADATTEQDIVVWRDHFVAREFGGFANDRLWLSAVTNDDRTELARTFQNRGLNEFLWIASDGFEFNFPGYEPTGEVLGRVEYFRSDIVRMTRVSP